MSSIISVGYEILLFRVHGRLKILFLDSLKKYFFDRILVCVTNLQRISHDSLDCFFQCIWTHSSGMLDEPFCDSSYKVFSSFSHKKFFSKGLLSIFLNQWRVYYIIVVAPGWLRYPSGILVLMDLLAQQTTS